MSLKLNQVPNYITEDIILLSAFFLKQEAQIADFQNNLDKHVEIAEVERWTQRFVGDEGVSYIDKIEYIAGISEEDYDIRGLFSEVMPTYQRQAMLLTLWGAFEYELEKMCLAVGKIQNKDYKLPDNKNRISTFMHIINELKRHGVPKQKSKKFHELINLLNNEVRHIRNAWAHNSGVDKDNKLNKIPVGITVSGLRLIISKEYIEKVINIMNQISITLNASTQKLFISSHKAQ